MESLKQKITRQEHGLLTQTKILGIHLLSSKASLFRLAFAFQFTWSELHFMRARPYPAAARFVRPKGIAP